MADEKEGKSSKSSHLVKKHHEKAEACYSRPSYRDPRWEKAVKVYTINMESKYILIQGVPSLGVSKEIRDIFSSYGNIQSFKKLDEYPTEEFTEVYQIKYERINNARYAKRKMDNKSFFGGVLHICYAPEFETVDETREKLEERQRVVARKIRELYGINSEPQTMFSRQPNITVPAPSTSSPSDTASQNIPPTRTCSSGTSTSTRTTEIESYTADQADDLRCQSNRNYSEFPTMPPPPIPNIPPSFIPNTQSPFIPNIPPPFIPNTQPHSIPIIPPPFIPNTQSPSIPNIPPPFIPNTQPPSIPNMSPPTNSNILPPPIPNTQPPSIPNIPPPPIPLHPSQYPPPPPPWELPRVPSANATLPRGLQNMPNITAKSLHQHPSQFHSSQDPLCEPYQDFTVSKSHGLPVPYEQNLGAVNIQASGFECSQLGNSLQTMDSSVDKTVQSIREKLKRVSSDSTFQGPQRELPKQKPTKSQPQSKKQRKRI